MKTGKYDRDKLYKTLQQLCFSDGVPSSEMRATFYNSIKSLQCVDRFKKGRGYIYLCSLSFEKLKEEIKVMLGIDLDKWKELNKLSTREEVADATDDTKTEKTRVDYGFDFNLIKPIEYKYDGLNYNAIPLPRLSIKVPDWRKFYISESVKIITVEGYSTMFNIGNKYLKLWSEGESYIFVLRNEKQNNIIDWLNINQPNNEVFHFGDYDMSGLQIYQNLKKKIDKSKRYHLYKFSPQLFEKMIKISNPKLFTKQYKYAHVDLHDDEVVDIVKLIFKYGKTIEQEKIPGYLKRLGIE